MAGELNLKSGSGGTITLTAADTAGSPVFTIPAETGTAITTGTTTRIIPKAAVPVGSVLQVVQTVKTDSYAASLGAVWGDLPGLSVSITPTSASSKILVMLDLKYIGDTDASISRIRLLRDSTPIYIGDAASNRPRGSGAQNYNTAGGSGGYNVSASGGVFLDSPATTGAVVYKVQGGGDANASIFYLNRTESDRDNAYYDIRTASSITVMEIAA
jgi:hypothetical protein